MTVARSLAPSLEALYQDYNRVDSASDPIQKVRPFTSGADREIAGFCAGALAFGRVASVLNSIDTLFALMGASPAAFVRRFDPQAAAPGMRAMVHRWIRGDDVVALLWILRQMVEKGGYVLSDGARRRAREVLAALHDARDRSFGNARTARNLFEDAVLAHADRVAGKATTTDRELELIETSDIDRAAEAALRTEAAR